MTSHHDLTVSSSGFHTVSDHAFLDELSSKSLSPFSKEMDSWEKNNFLMREMKFDKLEICELLQGKRRKRIESLKMEHILV